MPWATSNRKKRLPPNWKQIRAATRERAGGICEWVEEGARCTTVGTDCDHIEAMKDDHTRTQWLCRHHHNIKSSREGRQAQLAARRRIQQSFARPVEKHPGRIEP